MSRLQIPDSCVTLTVQSRVDITFICTYNCQKLREGKVDARVGSQPKNNLELELYFKLNQLQNLEIPSDPPIDPNEAISAIDSLLQQGANPDAQVHFRNKDNSLRVLALRTRLPAVIRLFHTKLKNKFTEEELEGIEGLGDIHFPPVSSPWSSSSSEGSGPSDPPDALMELIGSGTAGDSAGDAKDSKSQLLHQMMRKKITLLLCEHLTLQKFHCQESGDLVLVVAKSFQATLAKDLNDEEENHITLMRALNSAEISLSGIGRFGVGGGEIIPSNASQRSETKVEIKTSPILKKQTKPKQALLREASCRYSRAE